MTEECAEKMGKGDVLMKLREERSKLLADAMKAEFISVK